MKDHADSIFDRLGMVLRICEEGNGLQIRVVFGGRRFDSGMTRGRRYMCVTTPLCRSNKSPPSQVALSAMSTEQCPMVHVAMRPVHVPVEMAPGLIHACVHALL